MHHAQLLRTRIVHVEHILQPVRSLGHSHINPVGIIVLHAAVPDFLEAEDVFVKSVGGSPVFHHNPDMNDALRDAALGQELPEITAVKRARSELDELYEVSVRIRDLETSITILHGLKLLGHLHALAGQISSQLFRIGCLERDMRQAIHLRIGELREQLNILMVVYLEVRQKKATACRRWPVKRKGLLESKHAGIELSRRIQIVGSQTNMRHPYDGRALGNSPPAQQGHGEGESKAGILPRIGVEGSRITFYAASEIASSLSFSSAKTAFRVRATSM